MILRGGVWGGGARESKVREGLVGDEMGLKYRSRDEL